MRRRDFLRAVGALGGAAVLGGGAVWLLDGDDEPAGDSVLAHSPKECPVDTVVVLMLENRSFDHYYGWLGTDEGYLEAGRRRHGKHFGIAARNDLTYPAPDGTLVPTEHLLTQPGQSDPYRGCGHRVPGHGWFAGRAQRDKGFLATGTGNDEFAIGYYLADDLKVHARLAERFTLFDHYHASLLAGTFPNRQYQHAAQSEGRKEDPGPLRLDLYSSPTIWDKLAAKHVSTGYYYTDLPFLLLWGERMSKFVHPIDQFFEQASAGELPNVVFVDPGFAAPLRTDDHPLGDVRLGQRFLREVFASVASSPQWASTAFLLVYDEWGGFFDHVAPPVLPDVRASADDAENFGQAGFRVPALLASPHAPRGFVDHRVYDHTSILRFIEWRFLGAPAEGPGSSDADWYLTTRDRYANNIGRALRTEVSDRDLHFDIRVPIAPFTLGCVEPEVEQASDILLEHSDPFTRSPEFADYLDQRFPAPTLTPWIESSLMPVLGKRPPRQTTTTSTSVTPTSRP